MRALRHGLGIFGLAFLFQLQSWVISGGDFWRKLDAGGHSPCDGSGDVSGGPALDRPPSVRARDSSWLSAASVSLVTPLVVTSALWSPLPDPVEFYLHPVPGRAIFSLFPWVGFFLLGGAFGVWLDKTASAEEERRVVRSFMWLGLAMAATGYVASLFPSVYALLPVLDDLANVLFHARGHPPCRAVSRLQVGHHLGSSQDILSARDILAFRVLDTRRDGLRPAQPEAAPGPVFGPGIGGLRGPVHGTYGACAGKEALDKARAIERRVFSRVEPARQLIQCQMVSVTMDACCPAGCRRTVR